MKIINYINGFFLLILIVSCKQEIVPNDILKYESEFKLTVFKIDKNSIDTLMTKIINEDSEKILKLKDWIKNNPDGWQRSVASWATPDISLISNNFKLLIYENGIVVGFKDNSRKNKQYNKQVNKSEFEFLIE